MTEDTEERQRFEAWARERIGVKSLSYDAGADEYRNCDVHLIWTVWRASARTPRPEREVKP